MCDLPSERAVAEALAEIIAQAEQRLAELDRQPSADADRRGLLRDYNAATAAAAEWGRGIRPIVSPRGWLLPSRTRGGKVYEITKPAGYWKCGPNCEAHGAHWHTMLALGIERAQRAEAERLALAEQERAEAGRLALAEQERRQLAANAERARELRRKLAAEATRRMNECFA